MRVPFSLGGHRADLEGAGVTLREQLERLLEDLPPGGSVTFPRTALEELLETSAPAAGESGGPIGDLSVQDLAGELGRSESTVRGWCSSGLIDGVYKLRGREWRIPRAAARRFLEREARGEKDRLSRPLGRGRDVSLSAWRRHRTEA